MLPNGWRLSGAEGVRCSRGLGPRALEKLLELIDGQTGIPNDAAHREGIDRVVARNRDEARAVAQDRVLCAGTNYAKPGLLERPNRVQVI